MKTNTIELRHINWPDDSQPFLLSNNGVSYSLDLIENGLSLGSTSIYLKLKALNLDKDDLVLSVFIEFISTSNCPSCILATQTINNQTKTIDYSTNGFDQRHLLIDVTKAYSNFQTDRPIINISSTSGTIPIQRIPQNNNTDTAKLIINYVPKDAFGIRNKEITASLSNTIDYSINPANARFQLSKALFEQFLPYDLGLTYSSFGDEIISFLPKHWNINLIEKIEVNGGAITYTDSYLRKRTFKQVEYELVFYDTSGTGMVIKMINGDYRLYTNLHNQLIYKQFDSGTGLISEITLGYNKWIAFSYYSSDIIITDNYGNSISFSLSGSSILVSLENNSTNIDLSYEIETDYDSVDNYYYLTSITKIIDNEDIEVDTIIPHYDKIQRITTQSGDSVHLIYDSDTNKLEIVQKQVIKNQTTNTLDSLTFHYGYLSTKVDGYHGVSTVYNFDEDLNVVDEYLYQDSIDTFIYYDELLGQVRTFQSIIPVDVIKFRNVNNNWVDYYSLPSSYNTSSLTYEGEPYRQEPNYYFTLREALLKFDIHISGTNPPLPSKGKRAVSFNSTPQYSYYRGFILNITFFDNFGNPLNKLLNRYYFDVENGAFTRFIHIKMPFEAESFKIEVAADYLNSTIVIDNVNIYELTSVTKVMFSSTIGIELDNKNWYESMLFVHDNKWMSIFDVHENQILHNQNMTYQWHKNKTELVKLSSISNLEYKCVPYDSYKNNDVDVINSNDLCLFDGVDNFIIRCSSIINNHTFSNTNRFYGVDHNVKWGINSFSYLYFSDSNYVIAQIKHHSVSGITPAEEKHTSIYSFNDEKIKDIDSDGLVNENIINPTTGNIDSVKRYRLADQSLYFEVEYDYDSFDRLISKEYQSSTSLVSETYTYVNTSSLLNSKISPRNYVTSYEYENYSYLSKIITRNNFISSISNESTYDNTMLSSITNGGNKYIYEYDGYNLVNRIKLDDGSSRGGGIVLVNPLDPNSPAGEGDSINVITPPEGPDPNDDDYLVLIDNSISLVGNHYTVTYINGDIIQKYYDKYERLESIRYFVNNSMTSAIFTYRDISILNPNVSSSVSKLTRIEDEFSGIDLVYEYDDYSLMLENVEYKYGSSTHHQISYYYDGINRTNEVDVSIFNTTYKSFYTFKGLSNDVLSINSSMNNSNDYRIVETKQYDNYQRISKITTRPKNSSLKTITKVFNYYPNQPTNNKLSNLVRFIEYTQGVTNLYTESFEYDNDENITKVIKDNGLSTITKRYVYDAYGRLVRENNQELGQSKTYRYDNYGNINRVQIGNYSTFTSTNISNPLSTDTFTYDSTYKDLLVAFNGTVITYDDNFNPITYGNNISMTWERGRLLLTYNNTTTGILVSYEYNYEGIRTKKTVNNLVHEYYLNGKTIVGEKIGNTKLAYLYGITGVIGIVKDNGSLYYFNKNIFGDITEIYDSSGNLVNKYVYDAYGTTFVKKADGTTDNDSSSIGNLNPFRYRGYYYDSETQMYYCQSRYYYPRWRRWINLDSLSYLDNKTIFGSNLFAYCDDNPVMNRDDSGHYVVTGATLVIVGAVIGATIGAAANIAGQYIANNGWNDFNWASLGWNTLIGAAAGALSASSLGTFGMALANGAISAVGSIGNHIISGDSFNDGNVWGDIVISTSISFLTSFFCGAGATHGRDLGGAASHFAKKTSSYSAVMAKVARNGYQTLRGANIALGITRNSFIKAMNNYYSMMYSAVSSLLLSLSVYTITEIGDTIISFD